jgi:hypothetical protein
LVFLSSGLETVNERPAGEENNSVGWAQLAAWLGGESAGHLKMDDASYE